MKGIKHFITRAIAKFNNKKSTTMDERKTEFMKATEEAFMQLANNAKGNDDRAIIMIAIDKTSDGKTGTCTAVCGTGEKVIQAISDAIEDEHAGELFKEAYKRCALAHLLGVLSK